MKSPFQLIVACVVAACVTASGPLAHAAASPERLSRHAELSISSGFLAVQSQHAPALPHRFTGVPLVASLAFPMSGTTAVEGEVSWIHKQDTGVSMLGYQASVLVASWDGTSPWNYNVALGLGAVTVRPETGTARDLLSAAQTLPAIGFGVGSGYRLGAHGSLRADLRQIAAFPPQHAAGLSGGGNSSTIWMWRGTLGLTLRL